MRHISLTLLTLAFVAVLIPPYATLAENEAEEVYWNQFRGPNGDGKSVATDLPVKFSETQNIRWKNGDSRQGVVVTSRLGRPDLVDDRA